MKEGDFKEEWVKPGFALGTVGALVSDNASAKTMLAIQMAIDVASGRGVDKGGVLYLSADFSPTEICRRIKNTSRHPKIRLTKGEEDDLDRNFELWTIEIDKPSFDKFASLADDIIAEAKNLFKGPPLRLVIFDSLRHFVPYYADSMELMTRVFHSLKRICAQTGASCFMLHETSYKDSLLADYARYSEELFPPDWAESGERNRYFCWKITKQNYAPPSDKEIIYERVADQVLVQVDNPRS